MVSLGYKQSQEHHTLFIKHVFTCKLTLLLVYLDDMIIAKDNETENPTLNEKSMAQLEMKELGKLRYLRGIEVFIQKKEIFIFQRKYVFVLCNERDKFGCKTSGVTIK